MSDASAPARTNENEEEGYAPRLNEISNKFIADCILEKELLGERFPLAAMLIDEAIDKVLTTGRVPGREMYADVFKQKPMKVSQKVFVPTKQFPKFNFNGKILGPKGNSLRRLQEETMCKIKIKGRNSMRDAVKEEELRAAGDPRLAHLNKDLYVEISTVALPAEAYARVAYALAEIRKYLIPDKNDEVSQTQMKESMADPDCSRKATLYAEKFATKSSYLSQVGKKPTVSILQKITGRSEDDYRPREREIEDDRRDIFLRNNSQRAPVKRPQPSQPTYKYQGPQKRNRETSIFGQFNKEL
ncbi:KH domain-containing, RNA-binding, signal transduction-associated protein 3-like isoform X2 [Eupeodes corollae]|nr:KH domain-containing, RNA-binding, signal transduction-associated protein 3-like isoform X2 [Eupeodes corollae]